MKKQNLVGLMLATSVALATLAGCQTPMQTLKPGTGSNAVTQPGSQTGTAQPGTTKPSTGVALTPTKQQAATQNSQATADAMNDEQDMNAYDAMAADDAAAAYTVFLYDPNRPAPKDGEVSIMLADGVVRDGEVNITAEGKLGLKNPLLGKQRLSDKQKDALKKVAKEKTKLVEIKKKQDERRVKQKEQLAKRLDKMQDVREKMKGAFKGGWVAGDEPGTEKKTHTFEQSKTINGKTHARSVSMIRVRSAETKALISAHVSFSQELGNGLTRTSTRDKVLQEDGSYLVTFHSELTLAGGAKRVIDWTKTIAADGGVTGTGTIVWTGKDGTTSTKTVNLTIGGKEEAETATVVDPETKIEAEVAVTAGGETTAEVTNLETNAETTIEVEADPDAASIEVATETAAETTTGSNQGIAVGEPAPGTSPTEGDVEAKEETAATDAAQ